VLADTGTSSQTPQAAPDVFLAQAQSPQYVVFFALDDDTLNSEALATIASAAQEFQRSGSVRLSVRGHTDTSGNAEYNQALSERRERAVANELINQGVPADAIAAAALGETDPAVATGDGVPEAQNRRVEIAIEAPPPAPAPEAAPAPEPAPPVAEAPAPAPSMKRGLLSAGPFYGFNLEDENGGTSHLGGLNLSFDYAVLPWLGVGLEQAGFYHFGTDDEGLGGRSAAGLNLLMGDEEFAPYLGGNIGYLYGEGINDDAFAGPEIGLVAGPVVAKVAYDIPFNRDLDEGIIATTIGFGFRF
jgi:OmpA family